MIQMQTVLDAADNSGARRVQACHQADGLARLDGLPFSHLGIVARHPLFVVGRIDGNLEPDDLAVVLPVLLANLDLGLAVLLVRGGESDADHRVAVGRD